MPPQIIISFILFLLNMIFDQFNFQFNIETVTDENNPMKTLITTKLVLEQGKEEGDEPLVQVNKKLVRKLKPHQVEGK